MLERIKRFGWGYIAIAVLLIGIGISFVAFSDALIALAITVGITLTAFGIVYGVLTLAARERSIGFAIRITFAVLAIIAGVVVAVLKDSSVSVIVDIMCLLLIVDGSFKLNTAIKMKRFSTFGWWFMLTLSVAIIIASFAVTKLLTADTAASTLTVVMGIIIIADGLANFLSPFFMGGKGTDTADDGAKDKSPE